MIGGLDVSAPDGTRLLCAAGPGAVPVPAEGAAPYDAALLDLLGDPAQLGALRKRGLVTDATATAAIHIDHRLPAQEELARRCSLWRVTAANDGDRLPAPMPAAAIPPAGLTAAGPGAAGLTAAPAPPPSLPRPWRVLVLGGGTSGKSGEAELRLAAEPDVTYVATAQGGAADLEWQARIAAHRSRRPSWWRTVETTDVAAALAAARPSSAVLIDSIGGWLTSVLNDCGAWHRPPGDARVASRLADRIRGFMAAWQSTRCHVVAVSEEVGSAVVPDSHSGRVFRDELGRLNQLLAAQSEEALLVVAGRVLPLPG